MKTMKALLGATVELAIIEPWEFIPNVIRAVIEGWNEQTDYAVIRLIERVIYNGQGCTIFRMKARHETQSFINLCNGSTIVCNLVLVDETSSYSRASVFLDGWKGNIGLIASVKVVKD